MYSNKLFFESKNSARFVNSVLRPGTNIILLVIMAILMIAVISKIGFNRQSQPFILFVIDYHHILFTIAAIVYLTRAFICIGFKSYNLDFYVFGAIGILILLSISFNLDRNIPWLNNFYFYSMLASALFIFELSRFDIRGASLILNPAQLFMISFAFIIFT